MVKRRDELGATLAALADGTRRGLLEQLSKGQTRVTDLARPHRMSLPAISRHLRILEEAGLIVRTRVGREHRVRADPKPLQRVRDWIALYADVWQQQFDALDAYLEQARRDRSSPKSTKLTKRTKNEEKPR